MLSRECVRRSAGGASAARPRSSAGRFVAHAQRARSAHGAAARAHVVARASSEKPVALVTGGNTGMGFVSARELAAKGYHTIIACRSAERGQAALQKLQAENPQGSFQLESVDLASLATVQDLTKRLVDSGAPIDVLLNNAGVMATPEMKTQEGYEFQLGVNHLGHFALTAGLMPLLTQHERRCRIVNVSSTAHLFGNIDAQNINLTGSYNNWKAYGQSKLANVMFTFELARRLPADARIDTNTLHPGVVATDLARYLYGENPNPIAGFIQSVAKNFLKTPEQGASTQIYLSSSPEVEALSGKYFMDSKVSKSINQRAFDDGLREKLWDLSCEMTGVDFDVAALAGKPAAAVAKSS